MPEACDSITGRSNLEMALLWTCGGAAAMRSLVAQWKTERLPESSSRVIGSYHQVISPSRRLTSTIGTSAQSETTQRRHAKPGLPVRVSYELARSRVARNSIQVPPRRRVVLCAGAEAHRRDSADSSTIVISRRRRHGRRDVRAKRPRL